MARMVYVSVSCASYETHFSADAWGKLRSTSQSLKNGDGGRAKRL